MVGGLSVVASEVLQWRASKAGGTRTVEPSQRGLVVLGYPARRNGAVHPVQRWRVDIARSTEGSTDGIVVFSGAAKATSASEAAVMAAYAESVGIPTASIVLE